LKFRFRLQSVLDYRANQEDEAKQVYLTRRASRFEGESAITGLSTQRRSVLEQPAPSLPTRLGMEARLSKLDDEERFARTAVNVMLNEEEAAEVVWKQKRQALRSIELLKERELTEWTHDQERKEQAELDEWAVMRRRS
jgi:flagellar export protein FliJ